MEPMRFVKAGFTLTELLVATAVSLILCGVAFTGLVTFQQMSQQTDERLVQEAELQRALHLMATDIQEGKRIEAGAAPVSGYSPIFKSIRSDGSTILRIVDLRYGRGQKFCIDGTPAKGVLMRWWINLRSWMG
jgi:prepilin-type N-terminal cleavage/methylation domain-containing protein